MRDPVTLPQQGTQAHSFSSWSWGTDQTLGLFSRPRGGLCWPPGLGQLPVHSSRQCSSGRRQVCPGQGRMEACCSRAWEHCLRGRPTLPRAQCEKERGWGGVVGGGGVGRGLCQLAPQLSPEQMVPSQVSEAKAQVSSPALNAQVQLEGGDLCRRVASQRGGMYSRASTPALTEAMP